MNKEELLQTLGEKIKSKEVTIEEVKKVIESTKEQSGSLVSKILYSAGGLIAVVGVWVLMLQVWDDLGTVLKIGITSGFVIVSYIIAFLSARKWDHDILSQVLFTISALVYPVAAFTLIQEISIRISDGAIESLIISFLGIVLYGYALYATKKPLLHLVLVSLVSWFYYALVAKLVKGSGLDFGTIADITTYASMVLGIGVFSYANLIQGEAKNKSIVSLFTFASFATVLISGLILDGVWNLLYAFMLVGAVSLAVKIKKTSALVVTSIAIIAYLLKITSIYFADSLGWAIILILAGFIIIGVGYFTYRIHKKYIHA